MPYTEPNEIYYPDIKVKSKEGKKILQRIYTMMCQRLENKRPHPDIIREYPNFYSNKKKTVNIK